MSGAEAPVGIAIVGPTASGKTTVSLEVARRLNGEILSMDSRQVYRGMDIGTAKATADERAAVPHHGLDLVDPDERFSAGRFARYARRTIGEIRARGRVPILVGGTGFFLRALTDPIFREPEMDPQRRGALQSLLMQLEPLALVQWLEELDPEAAARLTGTGGGGGRQRILRALEIALLTGRPLTWWQRNVPPEATPISLRTYVLEPPRDLLYRSIDARVAAMLDAGLLDEVRSLQEAGFGRSDPGMNATGYADLLRVLEGEWGVEEAAERIRANTRAYARRQLTWLRHQLAPGAIWLDPTEGHATLSERIAREWPGAVDPEGPARTPVPGLEDETRERQNDE